MIITLTTDFGTADPFVGIMKGVILTIAPDATIVDITHRVRPQDVVAGALVLESLLGMFPRETIHVAVIDPGVGGERAALALETDQGVFVGPDNGLFTAVARRAKILRSVRLTNERYHRRPVSATFHGRDVFAPAAAYLARGVDLAELGEFSAGLISLPMPEPVELDGALECHVLTFDRFGNLVTDLTRGRFDAWLAGSRPDDVEVDVGATAVAGISRTYSDVPDSHPVAYFGSTDRLEIAIRNGSAEQMLNVKPRNAVTLRKAVLRAT